MVAQRLVKHRQKGKKAIKKSQNKVTKPQVKKKVVAADRLAWKSVEIPDTLDDFGGFYGLEELEGVGVEYVDGKPQFVMKDTPEVEPPKDVEMTDAKEVETKTKTKTKPKNKNVKKIEEQEKVLSGGSFKNADIPEEEADLPQWKDVELSQYTLQGLSGLDFDKPTPIQKKCIPLAMQGEDLIGKASTGSGKTLAYGIPILEKLIARTTDDDSPAGVIFTPTRELAHQVLEHINNVSKYFPFTQSSILSLTGGLSIQKQERLLKWPNSGQIVVATPGRFLELISKNDKVCKRFSNLDMLVLDEADRLLQDGHFSEFEQILKILSSQRTKKEKWQSSVFSATFAKELFSKLGNTHKYNPKDEDENKQIMELLQAKLNFRSKPTFIDLNPQSRLNKDIIETLIECLPEERDLYLYYFLLMYPGTTLVFTNAIDSVKRLVPFLNGLNIDTFAIHSNMIQKQRLKSLENFKKAAAQQSDKSTVLIASDVAARGLDISGIQHVVHYHLPRSADVYIHRSGRTARSGTQGVSVMICSPQEASGPLRNLRKALSDDKAKFRGKATKKWTKDVQRMPVEGDILAQLRDRARISGELADNEISTKSLTKEDNWMAKAADDLGVDLDDMDGEDEFLKKNRTKKENKQLDKQSISNKKFELKKLLSQSVRKDLRRSYLTGGLQNLADSIVKGVGHGSIVGHDKMDALKQLKKTK